MLFTQRILFPTTRTPGHCMAHMVKRGRSVLECFQSYEHMYMRFLTKGLQLGHTCAITDYHDSCTYTDCMCAAVRIDGSCELIHFATDHSKFKNIHEDNTTIHTLPEVYRMLYSNST